MSQDKPDVLFIDRMDNMRRNEIGGRNSVYLQPPSRVSFSKSDRHGRTEGNAGLKISYDKKNEGGPRDDGGFCGFYTTVKLGRDGYLDASPMTHGTWGSTSATTRQNGLPAVSAMNFLAFARSCC